MTAATIRRAVSRYSKRLESNKYSKAMATDPKFRDEILKIVESSAEIIDSLVRMPCVGAGPRSKHFAENAYSWAQIARGGAGIWFNGFVGAKNALKEADKTFRLYDMAKERGFDGGPLFFEGDDFDSKAEWRLGVISSGFKTASQALFSVAFGVCLPINLPGLIDKLRDRGRFPDALKYPEPLKFIGGGFDTVMMARAYCSVGATGIEMVREWTHYNNGGVYYRSYKREEDEGEGYAKVKHERRGYHRLDARDRARERLEEFIDRMITRTCALLDSAFKGTAYLFKVAHLEAVHPVFGILKVIFNSLSVVFGGIKTVREL